MKKGKFRIRRPDSMLLLAMLVSASVLFTTAAGAAGTGTLFSKPELGDFLDGDVTVVRLGRNGPAVHMSLIDPDAMQFDGQGNASTVGQIPVTPELYLTVRLPW